MLTTVKGNLNGSNNIKEANIIGVKCSISVEKSSIIIINIKY